MAKKLIPVDYTIQKIFEKIKAELKAEGIEIPIDTIHKVVDVQSQCIARGIANGDLVYAPKLGTFKIMKKIENKYNFQRSNRIAGIDDGHNTNLMNSLDERGLGLKIKIRFKNEIIRGAGWGTGAIKD